MPDTLKAQLIKKFFSHEDFRQFALHIPQGIMIINHQGEVILANEAIQQRFCKPDTDLTPFLHYKEVVEAEHKELTALIEEVYSAKRTVTRQIACHKRIFLVEGSAIHAEGEFRGCSISFSDITTLIQRERQHELLYQLSTGLSGVHSVSQVLRIAIAQIPRAINLSSANIMLIDQNSKELVVRVDTNSKKRATTPRTFTIGEGVAGYVAKERKPYSVDNVSENPLFTKRSDRDHGALLCVPITSKGKIFGVINVMDDTPRFFTENEVQFLTIIANDIAVALENSLLYNQLNKKIRELSKMFWLSSFIGFTNIEGRLQKIVRHIPQLFDAEGACVYLYSPNRQRLVLRYQSQSGANTPLQIDVNRHRKLNDAITRREITTLNSAAELAEFPALERLKFTNAIISPMVVGEKTVGMLLIYNKVISDFDDDDRHLAMITAHRISTKLDTARLVQKLQGERDLLDRIIQNSGEGVAVLDRKHRILVWNRYLEELTGIKASDAIGIPAYQVFFNRLQMKKLTRSIYKMEELSPMNNTCHIEERLINEHNESYWTAAILSCVFDRRRAPEHSVVLIRNTSKDKELLQAKDEFVSMTTHELRTPLTAVRGYLSMIKQGDAGQLTKKQEEYFAKAYNATERLSGLIEELLCVFRLDSNRTEFNIQRIPINPIIEQIIEEFSTKAKQRRITIEFTPVATHHVLADAGKTRQAISNLVDNAIKYNREGGKITITLEERGGELLVCVRDTGYGIPNKHLTTVFERFARVDNPRSVQAGGAGLGLYIVKNFIERQGGKIWATSTAGKETSFNFTLPTQ